MTMGCSQVGCGDVGLALRNSRGAGNPPPDQPRPRVTELRAGLCCPVHGQRRGNVPPSTMPGPGTARAAPRCHPGSPSLHGVLPMNSLFPGKGGTAQQSWVGLRAGEGERLSRINRLINLHICTLRISYFQRDAAASGCIPRSHQPGRAQPPPPGTGGIGRGSGRRVRRETQRELLRGWGGSCRLGRDPARIGATSRGRGHLLPDMRCGREARLAGRATVLGSSAGASRRGQTRGCSPQAGWHRGAPPQAAARLSSPGQCLTSVFIQSERAAV